MISHRTRRGRRPSLSVFILVATLAACASCSHSGTPRTEPSAPPASPSPAQKWIPSDPLDSNDLLWKEFHFRQDADTGQVAVSRDGHAWEAAALGSFLSEQRVRFAFDDTAAYVLGTSTRDGLQAVWASRDGLTWDGPSTIEGLLGPSAQLDDTDLAIVGFAAYGGRLMVAEFQNRRNIIGENHGLRVWTRRSGSDEWQRQPKVPALGTWDAAPDGGLVALPSGFFILGGDDGQGCDLYSFGPSQIMGRKDCSFVYRSTDGSSWEDASLVQDGGRVGIPYAISQRGDRLVLWGRVPLKKEYQAPGGPVFSTKLTAWYRDAASAAWQVATVEAGNVPDAGAKPLTQQFVTDVATTQQGFVAVGSSGETTGYGALWTSDDGVAWRKEPTKANGFHKTTSLRLPDRSAATVCGGGGERRPCWTRR
ncbi:hypothetical protein ACTOB_004689 [Actinoplanes oblitus]|uniref:Exo-alpha-sialidase n=1 Tax=Actinoplanes oblitus TaxID=3040509 RepID=A0ABY8W708_9ACTN|nr:hypothetical protein [Actinoplanes oblitus]WIM92735.1 hypothetical protein ACTOB_004689 [Actinoplanes oblitus]